MDTHEDFLGRIRYPGYHDRIMSAEKAAEFIKPEMTLGVSGFTIAGYPKAVAGELAKRARNGEKLEPPLVRSSTASLQGRALLKRECLTRPTRICVIR